MTALYKPNADAQAVVKS